MDILMGRFSCQFEKVVNNFKNKTAVIYYDNEAKVVSFTYSDLWKISESISEILSRHIEKKLCIGIAMTANLILPPVIIGVHKHQCSFFCIDINDTNEHNTNVINKLQINWILHCNTSFSHFVDNYLKTNATLVNCLKLIENYELELWKINKKSSSLMLENISYVIQTSGTTGNNKIVKVRHACIMPNIKHFRDEFKITETDIIYFNTPLTFDPFIVELYLALTTGACLLIICQDIKINHKLVFEILFPKNKSVHSGVTFLQIPPSLFFTFPEKEIKNMLCESCSLRILALGGENFPEKIFNFKTRRKELRIFNLYGITEVSCWASIKEINLNDEITLGEPLYDTILEVRDDDGKVIEEGQGEMYIGSSVRICILDDEEELSEASGKIIYRSTGDIVRKKQNDFYYVGRKDSFIKRFGHRVSLSQIEKTIYENTALNSVCVWHSINSKLITFIILKEMDKVVQKKILDKLRIKFLHCLLPVQNPDFIEIVPSVPLTKNGKIDRNCLLKIVINITEQNSFDQNSKDIFQCLMCKYFGLSYHQLEERKHLNFANFGGNSILAMQIVSEFENLIFSNSFSSDLMAVLLDNKHSYSDCCCFIESKIKITVASKNCKKNFLTNFKAEPPLKIFKTGDQTLTEFSIKWKHDLGACVDATAVSFEHPSFGGLIAIGSHANTFVILNAITGEVITKTVLSDAVEGCTCISVCKEKAIFGCNDGFLYCVDIAKNAEPVLWKFQTNSSIKCTPSLCRDNTCVVFGSYDKHLYCVLIKDGTLVWISNIAEAIKSSPLVLKERKCIYIASLGGTCLCVSEGSGNIIWKYKSGYPIFGSPCIINNLILWANVKGLIHCLTCDTGIKVWTYEAQGFLYGSLCNFDDFILFGCHDHNVYCLKYVDGDVKEIFKINIDSPISTSVCQFNKNLFVVASNSGKIHLFNLATRMLISTFQVPGEVFSSPVVQGNYLYLGCRDNNVYCIEILYLPAV